MADEGKPNEGKAEARRPDRKAWRGLTEEERGSIEVALCRTRTRGELFPEGAFDVARAIGRLNAKVNKAIRGMFAPSKCPSFKDMSSYINEKFAPAVDSPRDARRPTTGTTIREFLEGKVGEPDWVEYGRELFLYLLRGEAPPADPDDAPVLKRLDEYFFRGYVNKSSVINFLSRERFLYSEPCSPTELGGEVCWVIRDSARQPAGPRKARIVLVSGGLVFPFEDFDGGQRPGQDIADAIRAKLDVLCIYQGEDGQAARSIQKCETDHKLEAEAIRRLDLEGEDAARCGFLNPVLRFLYLKPASMEKPTLLILRHVPRPVEGRSTHTGPIALTATDPEREGFETWLATVDPPPKAATTPQAGAVAPPTP